MDQNGNADGPRASWRWSQDCEKYRSSGIRGTSAPCRFLVSPLATLTMSWHAGLIRTLQKSAVSAAQSRPLVLLPLEQGDLTLPFAPKPIPRKRQTRVLPTARQQKKASRAKLSVAKAREQLVSLRSPRFRSTFLSCPALRSCRLGDRSELAHPRPGASDKAHMNRRPKLGSARQSNYFCALGPCSEMGKGEMIWARPLTHVDRDPGLDPPFALTLAFAGASFAFTLSTASLSSEIRTR